MKSKTATAGGSGLGIGVLVVWLLGHFGVAVSAEVGATIAYGVTAAALLVAHKGVVGLFRMIWRGADPTP